MELEEKTNKQKKRWTNGLTIHVSPQFKVELNRFTKSINIDISSFARQCMAQYMRENGFELPEGVEVLTPGRRSPKKNLSTPVV